MDHRLKIEAWRLKKKKDIKEIRISNAKKNKFKAPAGMPHSQEAVTNTYRNEILFGKTIFIL